MSSSMVNTDPFEVYLEELAEPQRAVIRAAMDHITALLPSHVERRISWGMPTWRETRNIIHIAAQKHHWGIHPGAAAVAAFADELDQLGLKYRKGTIQIPYAYHVPDQLFDRLIQYCWEHQ